MADIKIAVLDDYMKIADSLADWTSLPDNVHTDFFTEKLPEGTDARATALADYDVLVLTRERTPPELAADIVDRGIMLVGGGSMLTDLDHLLREETKLPILRSDDPFTAVANGASNVLENLALLKEVCLD